MNKWLPALALLVCAEAHASLAPCGKTPAVAGVGTPRANAKRTVYLLDYVTVYVCHLDVFLREAEAREEKITLFVDGVDTGNEAVGADHDAGSITFTLDRTDKNKELWRLRLYDPLFEPVETIAIGTGKSGERPLPRVGGANVKVTLKKIYDHWTTWLWLALIIAIVIAVVMYARRTELLRDGPDVGGVRRPYSLARTQMAWWFLLAVVGYMFLWIITGDRDSIPASLLGLMGISAATALAAVAIAPASGGGSASMRKKLEEEIASIDEAIKRIDVDIVANPHLQAELERLRAERKTMRDKIVLQLARTTSIVPSRGIWNDLVCDDRGAVALDRLQILIWTLVLGGVFISTVLWDLTMPEFNATMLALMGISSGTYIGFKLPQART